MSAEAPSGSRGTLAAAWGVHLFTSLGVITALLALVAIEQGRMELALMWLFVALVIDGIDGTLARGARVQERLPQIDGDALDHVIDYLTYVFVPALFIWRGDYLPGSMAAPLSAAMLISSLYVFARRDMKTADGYFRGFPALWNVVAFYFFVIGPDPAVSAVVVVVLVIMTFAPVHVVHPFRVRDYGRILPLLATVWAMATAALLLPHEDRLLWFLLEAVSVVSAVVLLGLGLLRTWRGPRLRAQ